MICPECKTKITAKNYDSEFEWWECPKCSSAFTADEIEEKKSTGPVAKGKQRRTEIAEDEEALAKHDVEVLKAVKKSAEVATTRKDEVPIEEVISIMADELELIYEEMGGRLNTVNARDKALTLWREVHYKEGVHAREKAVEHVLCGAHS